MLKITYKLITAGIVYLCFIGFVFAGGMKVEPGLWETKSQVTSPGGTHENVSQDCIQESEISPQRMMDDNSGCEVIDSEVDAKSMQWSLRCENEGVAMTGEGNAQSSGNSITGGMDIKANFNGQEFTMSTKWQGTRVGDCE